MSIDKTHIEAKFSMSNSTVRFSMEDALDFLYQIAEEIPEVVIEVGKNLEKGILNKCPFPVECDSFPCKGLKCTKKDQTT